MGNTFQSISDSLLAQLYSRLFLQIGRPDGSRCHDLRREPPIAALNRRPQQDLLDAESAVPSRMLASDLPSKARTFGTYHGSVGACARLKNSTRLPLVSSDWLEVGTITSLSSSFSIMQSNVGGDGIGSLVAGQSPLGQRRMQLHCPQQIVKESSQERWAVASRILPIGLDGKPIHVLVLYIIYVGNS